MTQTTSPSYVREWLAAQAASGYAEYDASSRRFRLPPEQAFALTSEDNPLTGKSSAHVVRALANNNPRFVGRRAEVRVGLDQACTPTTSLKHCCRLPREEP